MEMVLYTIAALLLYGISDYILNTIEIKLQRRLPNRSLIFFVIISILAVSSFAIIQAIYPKPEAVPTSENTATQQPLPTGEATSTSPGPASNMPAAAQANESQSASPAQIEIEPVQEPTLPVTQQEVKK